MMKNKQTFLFKNFLDDKRTYTLNQNFWNNLIKKILKEKNQEVMVGYANQTFSNGQKMFDGNPIFSCFLKSTNRAFRIIQEEPESNELEFSNWFEETEIEDKKVNELVLSLELTREAKEVTQKVLSIWADNTLKIKDAEKKIEKITEPNKA